MAGVATPVLRNATERGVAILLGHADVETNTSGGSASISRRASLAVATTSTEAPALSSITRSSPRIFIVFDNENANGRQPVGNREKRLRASGSRHEGIGSLINGQCHDERRAVALTPAFGTYAPAMQPHQVTHDSETESETRLAAHSRVRLPKPFEDVREKRRGNADTGIRYGKNRVSLDVRQLHGDATGRLRELDRVPSEIPDNLF